MALIQSLKKITARDVIGKIEQTDASVPVTNDDGTPVLDSAGNPVTRKVKVAVAKDLFVVIGRARDHRVGKSAYGDSYVFVGDFEARRLTDGQVFTSTECIFPPIAQDMAISAYVRAKAVDKDAAVGFGFLIGCVPDARGTEGFKFTCKHQHAAEDVSDPLADLRSSLAMDFAETLGADTMAKIGLLPGEGAKMIPHDPSTGEVIEDAATEPAKGKAKQNA